MLVIDTDVAELKNVIGLNVIVTVILRCLCAAHVKKPGLKYELPCSDEVNEDECLLEKKKCKGMYKFPPLTRSTFVIA